MIVFSGPSLAGSDIPNSEVFDLRPPAQQGDIYLASLDNPRAIGVIDGYFEGVPSVWHKEILWALTRGIAVFGASSMGALRAAELDAFGMIGVGAIYQGYSDGLYEDDDEVALLHGPAEVGYPGLSLAMVNVRATLASARASGVLTDDDAARLCARAKAQFYKTRTWDSLLPKGGSDDMSLDRCAAVRVWIAENEVDQKRLDAQALLQHLASGAFERPQPSYHFEETALWREAVDYWRHRDRNAGSTGQGGYRLTEGLSFLDT